MKSEYRGRHRSDDSREVQGIASTGTWGMGISNNRTISYRVAAHGMDTLPDIVDAVEQPHKYAIRADGHCHYEARDCGEITARCGVFTRCDARGAIGLNRAPSSNHTTSLSAGDLDGVR